MLTDTLIRKVKTPNKPTKLMDGRGLFMLLSPSGGRWWRFRYAFAGKEKLLSFGIYPDVSLKHVDLAENCVVQDAREVATKFGKSFTTWFFPVGDAALRILQEWVEFSTKTLLRGPADPLFPATQVDGGAGQAFHAIGLARQHWTTADPVRAVFKRAFMAAGLLYFSPHRLRDTLASLGKRHCRTPEEFQAWAQNLGHSSMATTFANYGAVAGARQAEIIRGISVGAAPDQALEAVAALVARLQGRPAQP